MSLLLPSLTWVGVAWEVLALDAGFGCTVSAQAPNETPPRKGIQKYNNYDSSGCLHFTQNKTLFSILTVYSTTRAGVCPAQGVDWRCPDTRNNTSVLRGVAWSR